MIQNLAERSLDLTQFSPGYRPEYFVLDPETGFLTLSEARTHVPEDSTCFLGFVGLGRGCTALKDGAEQDKLLPLTHFADIESRHQTINLQGKGVGPRVWNLPHGTLGMPEVPEEIAAVTFDVSKDELLDRRNARLLDPVEVLRQIIKHAAVRSGRKTVEEVVEEIHRGYGNAGVVLRSIPPQARHRVQERLIGRAGRPSFALIRDGEILLLPVGRVPIDKLTLARR